MPRLHKPNIEKKTEDNCPSCVSTDLRGNGKLVLKTGSFGDFLGCSNFPYCKYTHNGSIKKTEEPHITEQRIRAAEERTGTPLVSKDI